MSERPDNSTKETGSSPPTATGTQRPDDHDPDDEMIDEIGEESFPASDSPSSWSGPPSDSR